MLLLQFFFFLPVQAKPMCISCCTFFFHRWPFSPFFHLIFVPFLLFKVIYFFSYVILPFFFSHKTNRKKNTQNKVRNAEKRLISSCFEQTERREKKKVLGKKTTPVEMTAYEMHALQMRIYEMPTSIYTYISSVYTRSLLLHSHYNLFYFPVCFHLFAASCFLSALINVVTACFHCFYFTLRANNHKVSYITVHFHSIAWHKIDRMIERERESIACKGLTFMQKKSQFSLYEAQKNR